MWSRVGRCPLRRAVLGGSAVIIGGVSVLSVSAVHEPLLASEPPPSSAALSSLWAAAIDGMISVPGGEAISSSDGVLYMTPASGPSSAPVTWPRVLSKSVCFSLTGWNPMGTGMSEAANREANRKLEQDIASMLPEPRAWWRSFGFNLKEGWREDGFTLAFAPEERMFAEIKVLRLARQYRQAAVYRYSVHDGVMTRDVVWTDRSQQATHGSSETMVPLREAPAGLATLSSPTPMAEGGVATSGELPSRSGDSQAMRLARQLYEEQSDAERVVLVGVAVAALWAAFRSRRRR